MGRRVLTKTYLMTLISSMFISNTLAATPDTFLGSWFGISVAGEGIQGVVNAALWYEINTLPQALIFIAVFGGIYFVTIKIIHMVFSYIVGAVNLGTSSRYSVSGSDEGPSTAEKGASAAIAFIATQYAGLLLGSAFFIAAIFSSLIIMIAFIRIFQAFRTGSSEMSVGSNGDSGGFINVDLSMGGDDNPDPNGDVSEAENAEEDAEEHEEAAEEEMEAAESDAESGDTERAGEEAEAAVQDMKTAIKDMDVAAADVDDLMKTEHEQLKKTINELNETLGIQEKDQDIIQHIKQRLDDSIQISNSVIDRVNSGEFDATHPKTLMGGVEGAEKGISHIEKDVRELAQETEDLKEYVTRERKEVDEEVNELIMEIQELASAHQLIKNLQREDKIGFEIDEEIENFAKALNSKEIYEEGEYEEKEEEKLRNKIQEMLNEESEIVGTLEKAENLLEKIDRLDTKEVDEIRREESEATQLIDKLGEIEDTLSTKTGSVPKQVSNKLREIGEHIEKLAGSLEQLASWKEEEDAKIKETMSNVKSALSSIEG